MKTGRLGSKQNSPKFDHLSDSISWLANISWRLPGAYGCGLVSILDILR